MSLVPFLTTYLCLNAVLLVSYIGLKLADTILKKITFPFSAQYFLRLHYFLISVCLITTVLHPLFPSQGRFEPPLKIWAHSTWKNFDQSEAIITPVTDLGLLKMKQAPSVKIRTIAVASFLIFSLIFLSSGLFLFFQMKSLINIRKKSFLIKKLNTVQVLVNDQLQIPFSYRSWKIRYVVLPSSLLFERENYKIALMHELQHHRQQDTAWVFILLLLRAFCVFNPIIHLWGRWIHEIQEFACDEALVDRKKVDSQAYARCLIQVAQTAIDQKFSSVCATGLTFLFNRHLLKRRIDQMLKGNKNKRGQWMAWTTSGVLTTVIAATALASKNWVQDRRVTFDEAQVILERIQKKSNFPLVLNDLVLKQLNRFVGTPEGRKYIKSALKNMEEHKLIIKEALIANQMPLEFLALPIVESHYENLPENMNTASKAAGLWQIIPSTAIHLGLKVDSKVDERMSVPQATQAALKYLKMNHLVFDDWQLSLLAYNMGESRVLSAIQTTGSRDAWELIRQGHEGDQNYLAKVMAAILITNDPSLVND